MNTRKRTVRSGTHFLIGNALRLCMVAGMIILCSTSLLTADCLEEKTEKMVKETVIEMQRMRQYLPAVIRRKLESGEKIAVTIASGDRIIARERGESMSASESEWIQNVQRNFEIDVSRTPSFVLLTVDEISQRAIAEILKARYRFNGREIITTENPGPMEHINRIDMLIFWFYTPTSDHEITLNMDAIFLNSHMTIPTRARCSSWRWPDLKDNTRGLRRLTDRRSEFELRLFSASSSLGGDPPGRDVSVLGGEIGGPIWFTRRSRYSLVGTFRSVYARGQGANNGYKVGQAAFRVDYRTLRFLNLSAGLDATYIFDTQELNWSPPGSGCVSLSMPVGLGLGLGGYHDRFIQARGIITPRQSISFDGEDQDYPALDWGGDFEFGLRSHRIDLTGTISMTLNSKLDEFEDDYRNVAGRLLFGIGGWGAKFQVGVAYERTHHGPSIGPDFVDETKSILFGIGFRDYGEAM